MVFVGQLMVALCFAELAANFPVAGSIYNWAQAAGRARHVAWLGGWMMLTASIVTISAVALAYQITLPQISDFFQFYGDGSGKYDFAVNAVILGTALIIFTTIINALGVKLMSRINSTGVFIELVAAILLIIALGGEHHARARRRSSRPRAAARATTGATSARSSPPRWPRPTSCTASTPPARSARSR